MYVPLIPQNDPPCMSTCVDSPGEQDLIYRNYVKMVYIILKIQLQLVPSFCQFFLLPYVALI